ncbi:MAG TPA: hypothetical protein VFD58_05470 [Blastocatellia bacterium]|nr:hypothetical protein [Blastocatellia bacterium]
MASRLNTSDLLESVRGSFRGLRLSLVESVFLIAAILFAGVVTFLYLTKIQPRNSEIADLNARLEAAQKKIAEQGERAKQLAIQRVEKERLINSLKDFEERLKDKTTGTTKMITEINDLSRAHHLAVTGYIFKPQGAEIIPATPALAQASDSTPTPTPPIRIDKELNLYPSLGIDTTFEGEYRDLRHFIYNLERSQQFLIINSLAFQGVDEKTRQVKNKIAPSAVGNLPDPTRLSIGLKIELDAYFQKPEGMKASATPASTDAKANDAPAKGAK